MQLGSSDAEKLNPFPGHVMPSSHALTSLEKFLGSLYVPNKERRPSNPSFDHVRDMNLSAFSIYRLPKQTSGHLGEYNTCFIVV